MAGKTVALRWSALFMANPLALGHRGIPKPIERGVVDFSATMPFFNSIPDVAAHVSAGA